jgi:hypothetical protein
MTSRMPDMETTLKEKPADSPGTLSDNLEIRRHEGRRALRDLAGPLTSAGFLPAPLPGMEPEYLAAGSEGDHPGAMVAYSEGRVIAYMPYALRRAVFPIAPGPVRLARIPYRQLRLFGYASKFDGRASILDLFFQTLLAHTTWHVAEIIDLPADDPLCRYVTRKAAESKPAYGVISKPFDTIQVRLDETFTNYLMNQFSKKTRYNLKREVRLLEDAAPGEVAVKVYTSPDEVRDFLRDAEKIARLTYQWKLGFNTMRADPELLQKLSLLAKCGRFRSYILFIRDTPAAYCCATVRQGDLSYDNVGYDPQFAKLNPGKVLLYRIVEDLHEWRRVGRLEFGRGPADYKQLFANCRRVVLDIHLYSRRPYSQFLRLLRVIADIGFQSLRPLVQPLMPYIKRRFRTSV